MQEVIVLNFLYAFVLIACYRMYILLGSIDAEPVVVYSSPIEERIAEAKGPPGFERFSAPNGSRSVVYKYGAAFKHPTETVSSKNSAPRMAWKCCVDEVCVYKARLTTK